MGGSRRINVRGSALRSPFAVRNTMLFVRGFMLTEADGTSPVEWLDPAWSGGMELFRVRRPPRLVGIRWSPGGSRRIQSQSAFKR